MSESTTWLFNVAVARRGGTVCGLTMDGLESHTLGSEASHQPGNEEL